MAADPLQHAVIYLGAAVVLVPLASRLGLGSVIGYLLAGMLIGPWGLGLISNVDTVLHYAEFGVVLLLFLIGLELNPKRLWQLRKPILGMGGAQVGYTILIIWGVVWISGEQGTIALIIAMGLALSSTAIALQTLTEKNLMPTRTGTTAFSILLFQDIAVIPMLAIIPLLIQGDISNESSLGFGVIKVVGVIGTIIVVGHYLNRPIFRFIAKTGLREVFTAFALFLVIGISLIMQQMEMSMALGSFLAGVLLADSEYRHELELEIEPFKGLLLGLFFIAVGMSINLPLLLKEPLFIFLAVVSLIVIKGGVIWALSGFGSDKMQSSQRLLLTIVLSQGGEFAFVIFTVAVSSGLLPPETRDTLILIVALSMMTTPLLLLFEQRFLDRRMQPRPDKPTEESAAIDFTEHNPVIIAGFGRYGRIIGRLLHANSIQMTILDHDPDQIEELRPFGYKVYYGDATRTDTLRAAGAEHARLMVIALDDPVAVNEVLICCKTNFPHLKVISRCRDMPHGFQLLENGVDHFQRELLDSALHMGEVVLKELGYGAYHAKRVTQTFTKHDRALFNALFAADALEKRITIRQQDKEELKQVFLADEEAISRRNEGGWD